MRAPVYRSLEAKNSILGLSFPTEFTVVLCAWWAGMILAGAFLGSAIAAGTYLLVRVMNYGHAEGHVQHLLQFQLRRLVSGGSLSVAARAGWAPRFPHGRYRYEGEALGDRLVELVPSHREPTT